HSDAPLKVRQANTSRARRRVAQRAQQAQLTLFPLTCPQCPSLAHRTSNSDCEPPTAAALDCSGRTCLTSPTRNNAPTRGPYKAGLSSESVIINAGTGRVVTTTAASTTRTPSVAKADVGMPGRSPILPADYRRPVSWLRQRTELSLTHVNLYYPICCKGMNVAQRGQKYSSERQLGPFHTVVMFDTDGRRESPLRLRRALNHGHPGRCATQKLKCSVKLENLTSGTPAARLWPRCCKKTEEGCQLDTTWLMEPDIIPDECFSFSGGMMRIEVDYFCTAPRYVRFDATGQGATGSIIRYFVPKKLAALKSRPQARRVATTRPATETRAAAPGSVDGAPRREANFVLERGRCWQFVVGQHGGNSSEVSPSRRPSSKTMLARAVAAAVLSTNPRSLVLYLAAGGGGGASYTLTGVPDRPARTAPTRPDRISARLAGAASTGSAGWTNTEAASYHGGCGAGWLSGGARRADPSTAAPDTGGPLRWAGGGSFCNATMFSEQLVLKCVTGVQ
uniref:Protein kinase domain-containing protein n=1 Tax=Macrostomum lignano TaxID=282301 RepID=A0A1I8FEJ6_9PLAT